MDRQRRIDQARESRVDNKFERLEERVKEGWRKS